MNDSVELRGHTTALRTVQVGDRTELVRIRSTAAVRMWWRGQDLAAEFDADLADIEVHRLTILDVSGKIVGLVQYFEEPDPDYHHASVDIYIDPAVHRRGYATDALRTLVDHLFDRCGHHRLTIDPAADNHAAIACYSKIGFAPVGVMRAYERRSRASGNDALWADGLLMDMLASDRTTPVHFR